MRAGRPGDLPGRDRDWPARILTCGLRAAGRMTDPMLSLAAAPTRYPLALGGSVRRDGCVTTPLGQLAGSVGRLHLVRDCLQPFRQEQGGRWATVPVGSQSRRASLHRGLTVRRAVRRSARGCDGSRARCRQCCVPGTGGGRSTSRTSPRPVIDVDAPVERRDTHRLLWCHVRCAGSHRGANGVELDLATPRSAISTWVSPLAILLSSRFPGVTSRWMMSCAWSTSTARHASAQSRSARTG